MEASNQEVEVEVETESELTFEQLLDNLEVKNSDSPNLNPSPVTTPEAVSVPEQAVKEVSLQDAVKDYLSKNKVRILIGTPCFGGQVHSGYFQSMCELIQKMTLLGINYEILNIGNESLVTRARNGIVAKFLGQDEYTHLMFIDADVTFPWLGVIRLLLSDRDLCGACYPKKNINWEKVKQQVKKDNTIDTKLLLAKSLDYVFNPVYFQDEQGNTIAKMENGFVRVKDIATGFMMIKKNVFTAMKLKFPELKYNNNVAGYHTGNTAECFYSFFDTAIDEESRVYLSEDYLFCKRWRQLGGDLWLDLQTNLNHTGTMDFIGSLMININEMDDLNADTVVTQNTIVPGTENIGNS